MSQNGSAGGEQPARFAPPNAFDALLPGDALDLAERPDLLVRTVFHGSETLQDVTVEWRWIFLDDGSLLELAPKGRFLYPRHQVEPRGSPLYEEMVAQDGALVRFERHVREGSVADRPVHITLDERRYRVASTGTCLARRLGAEPELAPWRGFRSEPDQNVYFNLVEVDDESSVALGLWTTDLCLSFGRPLEPGDIRGIRRPE